MEFWRQNRRGRICIHLLVSLIVAYGLWSLLIISQTKIATMSTTPETENTWFENGVSTDPYLKENKEKQDPQLDTFLSDNPPKENEEKINWYLHEYHLTPPSNLEYNFDPEMKKYPSDLDSQLRQIFRHKKNGFFVEAGANDGQFLSNTLMLEIEQNWTGLLIEPNPYMVPALRMVNRKAWVSDVCLSMVGYPTKVRFTHDSRARTNVYSRGGGNIEKSTYGIAGQHFDPKIYIFAGAVDCFPLSTVLAAIKQTVVDYFSFDVEGVEYLVLKLFPFDKIRIKVLSVEHNLIPEGYDALEALLTKNNYEIIYKSASDLVAVHKDYTSEYKLDY